MFPVHAPTFDALVRQRAEQTPDRPAVRYLRSADESVEWSYADIDQRARAIAAELQRRRMSGERVLLLFDHADEFLTAFLGCLYSAAIAVPLCPPRNGRSVGRVASVAATAGATLVLSGTAEQQRIGDAVRDHAGLHAIDWLAAGSISSVHAADWTGPVSQSGDVAFLQYTSGSTDDPKGVVVRHSQLLHNSQCIARGFGHTSDSRGLIWLPVYHDMGLIGGLLQPLFCGFPVTLLPPATVAQRPLLWLENITRFGATTSGAPNFAYDLCVDKVRDEDCIGLDLSTWQVAFTGAEPVQAATIERFCRRFEPFGFRREAFYPCYGMAETTLMLSGGDHRRPPVIRHFRAADLNSGRATSTTADDATSRPLVGCGQTVERHELRIVDPQTQAECAPGVIGEIWTCGPSVADGYWNAPEVSRHAFHAELAGDEPARHWLRTGDLGFVDQGELFIAGRLKDVIIIRGKNHYPQDLELTASRAHPAVQPAIAAAFTVPRDGVERLVIVQEIRREAWRDLQPREVAAAIVRAVAEQHSLTVESVVLLRPASLPLTSSGKVRRGVCRQQFLERSLQGHYEDTPMVTPLPTTPGPLNTAALFDLPPSQRPRILGAFLKRAVAEAVGCDVGLLDSSQRLSEFGLDSMQLMQLKLQIDELIGGEFDLDLFLTMPTLAQLAEAAASSLNGKSLSGRTQPATVAQEAVAAAPPENAVDRRQAPGPADLTDSAHLRLFQRDFFGHLLGLSRDHGELVRFRWGRQLFHLASNPDDLKEVFVNDRETYIRGKVWEPFRNLMGTNGLITTEGQAWSDERRVARPMFSQSEIFAATDGIAEIVDDYLGIVRGHSLTGEPIDFMEDAKEITLRVILHKLFSATDDDRLGRLMKIIKPIDDLWDVPSRFIVAANPSAAHIAERDDARRQFERIVATLDPLLYSWIDEHLEHPDRYDDMVSGYLRSELCRTRPAAAARRLLRDMAVTIILTGFDTTSAALFWTLHLLSKHPDALTTLRRELDTLNLTDLAPETLSEAGYLQATIHESLRLYPPVWYVGREVTRDATLRGYDIPAESFVLASPYVVHRNPRLWPDPHSFRPERFLRFLGSPFNVPGYLPFGLGPRFCIGRPLAMHEIGIVVARLCAEFDLESDAPEQLALQTVFTLRPKDRVLFRVTARHQAETLRPAGRRAMESRPDRSDSKHQPDAPVRGCSEKSLAGASV